MNTETAGDEGPPLTPIIFDTTTLPLDEQLPAFAAYSPNSRMDRIVEGPFRIQSTMWPLDEMILSQNWLDPLVATRDDRKVKARPADHYMAFIPLSGTMDSVIGGIRATCGPGQILVNDFSQPSVTISSGAAVLVLAVSRAFLDGATGGVHAHGILPSTGETRILIDFLQSLTTRLPQTRMGSVPTVSRIVRDLLAMAIRAGGAPAASPPRSTGVRARVRRHIAALPPGEIDVPALMKDLGLSRSTLFRAFRQDGGVLCYDRQRRLRMLHRLLVEEARDARSIAELGLDCGFRDMPALSRQFRAQFGYTMSDLRRHADHPVTPVSTPSLATSGERYLAFVTALS